MPPCQKSYHNLYLQQKQKFDSHVIEWVRSKEDIIVSSPLSNPLMKHDFSGIRRFKSGKLRILYAISTEKPDLWNTPPLLLEVMFLYVDMRHDETYTQAYTLLKKGGIFD